MHDRAFKFHSLITIMAFVYISWAVSMILFIIELLYCHLFSTLHWAFEKEVKIEVWVVSWQHIDKLSFSIASKIYTLPRSRSFVFLEFLITFTAEFLVAFCAFKSSFRKDVNDLLATIAFDLIYIILSSIKVFVLSCES